MKFLQITWSPLAKTSYFNILQYLEDNWSIREIEIFIDRTEEVLTRISKNSKLYPYSKIANIHKCVLFKQVSLFYKINDQSIELLIFWDTRQDPKKLML